MNIKEMHPHGKAVSSVPLFKGDGSTVAALRILQDQRLKEHVTQTRALLVCVSGEAIFENEKGLKETLLPGDHVMIEPMVKHWVDGVVDSNLLLIK